MVREFISSSFWGDLNLFVASIYLIIIIASLGLRKDFVNATPGTISAMANAFRQPPDGETIHPSLHSVLSTQFIDDSGWGTIIRHVIIPRIRILQKRMPVSFIDQILWVPSESTTEPTYLKLSDLSTSDLAFGDIKMQ